MFHKLVSFPQLGPLKISCCRAPSPMSYARWCLALFDPIPSNPFKKNINSICTWFTAVEGSGHVSFLHCLLEVVRRCAGAKTCICSIGDIIAQEVIKKKGWKNYDFQRTLKFGVIGLFYVVCFRLYCAQEYCYLVLWKYGT